MSEHLMGWNLPPGCTDRDVDKAAPGYWDDECDHADWCWEWHGRRCPECGELMVDD